MEENDKILEGVMTEFEILEIKKFNIMNNYVMGIVTPKEIEDFRNHLFAFRDKVYAIPISDNNLLEIAKIKSKLQHFDTEVLEDEDVLRVAYQNVN